MPATAMAGRNQFRVAVSFITEIALSGSFLPLVIVGIARDVVLLPVAESNFEHADGFIAAAGKPVLFIRWNPDFVTGPVIALRLADLHHRAVINGDPQLGASSVRLEAEPLPGQYRHQADGAIAVIGVKGVSA